jgi:hypothetical protein
MVSKQLLLLPLEIPSIDVLEYKDPTLKLKKKVEKLMSKRTYLRIERTASGQLCNGEVILVDCLMGLLWMGSWI